MADHRFVEHNPTKSPYSPRIPVEYWQKHEEQIRQLHKARYTRKAILKILSDDHSPHPSKGQLQAQMKVWKLKVYKATPSRSTTDQVIYGVTPLEASGPDSISETVHEIPKEDPIVGSYLEPSVVEVLHEQEKTQTPFQACRNTPLSEGRVVCDSASSPSTTADEKSSLMGFGRRSTGSSMSLDTSIYGSPAETLATQNQDPELQSGPLAISPTVDDSVPIDPSKVSDPMTPPEERSENPESPSPWKGIFKLLRHCKHESPESFKSIDFHLMCAVGDCLSAAGCFSAAFSVFQEILDDFRFSADVSQEPLAKIAIDCAMNSVSPMDAKYAMRLLKKISLHHRGDEAALLILQMYLANLRSCEGDIGDLAVALESALLERSKDPAIDEIVQLREHLPVVVKAQRYFLLSMTGYLVGLPPESNTYHQLTRSDDFNDLAEDLFTWCKDVVAEELEDSYLLFPSAFVPPLPPYQNLFFILLRAWLTQSMSLIGIISKGRYSDPDGLHKAMSRTQTLRKVFSDFELLAGVAYMIVADNMVKLNVASPLLHKPHPLSTRKLLQSFDNFLHPGYPLARRLVKACFALTTTNLDDRMRATHFSPADLATCFLSPIYEAGHLEAYVAKQARIANQPDIKIGPPNPSLAGFLEAYIMNPARIAIQAKRIPGQINVKSLPNPPLAGISEEPSSGDEVLAPSPRSSTSSSLKMFHDVAVRLKRNSGFSMTSKLSKASSNAMSLDSRESWRGSIAGFSMTRSYRESKRGSIRDEDEDMLGDIDEILEAFEASEAVEADIRTKSI